MNKTAIINKSDEEWYLSFKGTPYESMAYDLLSDLYALDLELTAHAEVMHDRQDDLSRLEYQLQMLNLDRMRDMPDGQQVIVIHAKTKLAWFGEAADIQEFIDAFTGSPQESEAMRVIREYLTVKEFINKLDEGDDDFWARREELTNQMESLSLEALQRNVEEKIPTTGIEAFPEMAGEIAELMQGVTMDSPLEPRSFMGSEDKDKKDKFVPVEDRIIEVDTDGLDSATTEQKDRLKFEKGDSVTLSKTWDVHNAGGAPHTFPKGTKGQISSIFDGQGHEYMVQFDDGGLVRVPVDHLN